MDPLSSFRAGAPQPGAPSLIFRRSVLALFCCALGCSAGSSPGTNAGAASGGAGPGAGGASSALGGGPSLGAGGANGGTSAIGGTAGSGNGGAGASSVGGSAGTAASGGQSGSSGASGNSGSASLSGGAGAGGSAGAGTTGGTAGRGGGAGGATGSGGNVGPDPSSATRMLCTGTDPIACHFGGPPGNYDVTVVLGGNSAARTTSSAETLRDLLLPVATSAGQTQRFTFTVNVRQPEGQPLQAVPPGTPGLDLYFAGSQGVPPELASIGYATASKPFMIYLAGDSTVCDQSDVNYTGWGQELPVYFDYPVSIANYADSGESSGSFLNSGALFGAINSRLATGDYVFIQFGHNDKTTTATVFHDNMTALVTAVKAKGGIPVLFTPVARSTFDSTTRMLTPQHINDTGANLPDIVKTVGAEQNVVVLDLLARTIAWNNQIGPSGWQQFHALGTDATHFNQAGAAVVAGFVHDLIGQAALGALSSHFRF
jgi:lysophospholipase L1-like esterase